MRDRHIDIQIDKLGSKYTLVVAVAKRAQQIRNGAVPVVSLDSHNPVTIALAEIASDEVMVNPEQLLALGERQAAEAHEPARDEGLEEDLLALADLPGDEDFDDDLDLEDVDLLGEDDEE